MASDSLKTFFEFLSMEAKTDSESVGIPENISKREDDALGLEHRPAELLTVLESSGNRREPVYTRRSRIG